MSARLAQPREIEEDKEVINDEEIKLESHQDEVVIVGYKQEQEIENDDSPRSAGHVPACSSLF